MDNQTIHLTPQTIAQYKDFLTHPEKYPNCDYKPLHEIFTENDTVTPQDILYQQYIQYINKPLPKFIFYIIMEEEFPQFKDKEPLIEDELKHNKLSGRIGYKLKLKYV